MPVSITGFYLGNKKVCIKHEASGVEIKTAAPLDNNGDGSSFSPTDLFAASLGSCMLTIMGIFADNNNIDLNGSHFELKKEMSTNPRRIGAIPVTFHLPKLISNSDRIKLERSAMTCPVHHSLHPGIEIEVDFLWDA